MSPRASDRAPDWVAAGTPEPLAGDLSDLLGADALLGRAIDIVRYASDASPYRRFPKAVVRPKGPEDVAKLFGYSRSSGIPVTFRSGGTSLNGQSQSDGIMADVRHNFRGVNIEDGGARARVGPGTSLGHVNRTLARHWRKLGPDPASTDFATVGGVVANNSGGMRCGVVRDSYRTVAAMKLVLASGTVIDTEAADAERLFADAEPELAAGLLAIRDEIRDDEELAERIKRKFEIKNTTGYRLCAFLDADTPLEIFRRLVVGSEGTLAFIAEVVYETVPLPRRTSTSWLHFPGIEATAEAVPGLVAAGATAVELMVAPALIAAAHNMPGTPEAWKELPPDSAALLVEFGAETDAELDDLEAAARKLLGDQGLIRDPDFTREAECIELNWKVREALHGLLGRLKPPANSLIIEDVCVPPERIAESALDLQALLTKHGFLPGVAGHASAGNLHFMLTPDFSEQADLDRYDAFMGELVELIVGKYDGSLKAEHGTGVNMAPFVEREWGAKATALMWRVKELADPDGLLAPGVLLNRDRGVHLRDLKSTPEIEEIATACVECGFCEPVCPSRDLTLTPRQRILVRREIARQGEGTAVHAALTEAYRYDGIETCAADGTCMLACPVGIDTGKLIKGLRAAEHSEKAQGRAARVAERWGAAEKLARGGLRFGKLAGNGPMRALTGAARRVAGEDLVPAWTDAMPAAAKASLPATKREDAAAVYMPACVNRIFGAAPGTNGGLSLPEALVAASERAGAPLWIPGDVAGNCCATPWNSKGYTAGAAVAARRLVESMWRWTDGGELPVVIDASSCALGAIDEIGPHLDEGLRERHAQIEILDALDWAAERIIPKLEIGAKAASAVIHPPCASRHLGSAANLGAIAAALADEVVVPTVATCCGFAGDRGMLHPELTISATRELADELSGHDFELRLSSNRTCEIGLQQATGEPFESFAFALERLSR